MRKEYSEIVLANSAWTERIKTYPDGTFRFTFAYDTCFILGRKKPKNAFSYIEDEEKHQKTVLRKQKENNARAKVQVFDLALANAHRWKYFITLTLSSEYVDRKNYDECSACVLKLTKLLGRFGNSGWIIVPELHKDGSYHFHGLVYSDDLRIAPKIYEDSGRPVLNKFGEQRYKLPDYPYGFSDVELIRDPVRSSFYITKYFSKGFSTVLDEDGEYTEERVDLVVPKGKKRYWASLNLERPDVYYDQYDLNTFDYVLANARFVNSTKLKQGTIIYADLGWEGTRPIPIENTAFQFDILDDLPDVDSPLFNKIFILLTNIYLCVKICI